MQSTTSATSSPPAPSFSTYSNKSLAQIAARVVREFHSDDPEFYFQTHSDSDSDSEFEFPSLTTTDVFQFPSPVPADELFQNGQIRPVYPLFNRDLLSTTNNLNRVANSDSATKGSKNRQPLRELFIEERKTTLTAVDELEGVPEEMYCVWMPDGRLGKKSSSAGSNSKRWKFKDLLLNRSHSEGGGGKGSFVF